MYFSEVLGKRYIERKMKPGYINTEGYLVKEYKFRLIWTFTGD